MDQLTELFKQMQELAGVGLDMLQGAKGGQPHAGGQHPGGAPGGAPHPGGAPAQGPGGAPESEKQEGPPQPTGR